LLKPQLSECDDDSEKRHRDAGPLQRAQAFLGQELQPQCREDRRRVEEYHRVRGGRMHERLTRKDEFERK